MSLPLEPHQLLRDSLPIAVILTLWMILDIIFFQVIFLPLPGGFRWGGIVMALLYVVVKGVQRGREISAPTPTDIRGILIENAQVLLVAGVWFVLAGIYYEFSHYRWVLGPLWFLIPSTALGSFVFAATGVLTVVYCAVALGKARVSSGSGGPSTATLRADD